MIALDTNILIYACDKADLKRQQVALDLVSSAARWCAALAGRV
jgi:predicted nucleic acid-binding protein